MTLLGPRPMELPNLITNVATTDATIPDVAMTDPIHRMLDRRGLPPGQHYLDSGYPSAELMTRSRTEFGIELITPLLGDQSPQARVGAGYDRASFSIDFDHQRAICPQGHTSSSWNPVTQRGTDTIVISFPRTTRGPCPVREHCTTSRTQRRQLTVHTPTYTPPNATSARSKTPHPGKPPTPRAPASRAPSTKPWRSATPRHARYRGLRKVHLQQVFSAVALNLTRLHAYWNAHPMDRTRTSHLSQLELALTA
jgi:hypothetical protein